MVSNCECEPYLTTDHRIMLEQAVQVLHGARIAMGAVGAARAVVGVEDNKLDAVAALRAANGSARDITIEAVPTKYPEGAEKIPDCEVRQLGRRDPLPRLPADVGLAVFNVATLPSARSAVYLPLKASIEQSHYHRFNRGAQTGLNFLSAAGHSSVFGHLEQAGKYRSNCLGDSGGPMMGRAGQFLDVADSLKGVSGILVLTKNEVNGSSRILRTAFGVWRFVVSAVHFMSLNPSRIGCLARRTMATKWNDATYT